MLAGIQARRCRIVVAWEASRYYRDLEVYVRLRNACAESDVLLCYNGMVFDLSRRDDRRATAQDAIQAEDEAEGIRNRTLRTHQRLAEECRFVGYPPFGYIRVYDPDTGAVIGQAPHPVRAPFVTESFDRCAAGKSLHSIKKWLNSEPDARRPRGGAWTHGRVREMLRNPAYIGHRIHRGRDMGKGPWEPLVTEETFAKVQRILNGSRGQGTRDCRARHLLSGLALCGEHEDSSLPGGLLALPASPDHAQEYAAWLPAIAEWCFPHIRRLYAFGFRPTLPDIRRALMDEGGPQCSALALAALRTEIERREPELAALPTAPPPKLLCGIRNGNYSYYCTALSDTGIRATRLEAYVEEAVIRWLQSDAAVEAFRSVTADSEVENAHRRLSALTAQLEEARELAGQLHADGTPRLSALSLATMERRLLPQIREASARASTVSAPSLVNSLAGHRRAEATWAGLDIHQKRVVLRKIVTVRLFRAPVKGSNRFAPERVRLSFVGQRGFLGGFQPSGGLPNRNNRLSRPSARPVPRTPSAPHGPRPGRRRSRITVLTPRHDGPELPRRGFGSQGTDLLSQDFHAQVKQDHRHGDGAEGCCQNELHDRHPLRWGSA
ncbi:hypothetical protein ADL21_11440 [Streptomyces albus subsp. albus]|nr:hypothetical protein ADL21_11440 [Streptomyces albus subsp. albus]